MRKALLSALAAVTTVSTGMFASSAAAMTAETSAVLAPAAAAFIREAAVVCGATGCTPVQTKAQVKKKYQWLGHG
jgi:hypothetical protein